jgi:xanthine dehydrogenase accessory factor
MSERLFARLAARLAAGESPVLACVLDTRGATPRQRGACMLVDAGDIDGTIGGGEAEARVVAAARALREGEAVRLAIDLTGRPGAAGVCGGHMDIAARRWSPAIDLARAREIADRLAQGERVPLAPSDVGADQPLSELPAIEPDARLLIVGGGHCGEALHRLARELDFDVWVHDARAACFAQADFTGATVLCGDASRLAEALDTARPVYAVLLNRDYPADIAALAVIAPAAPVFVGMMGSRRRVAQVRAALPQLETTLASLASPVGLEIGAETPEEIAVSILAQLIAARSALRGSGLWEGREARS